jgi:hypothetical protein
VPGSKSWHIYAGRFSLISQLIWKRDYFPYSIDFSIPLKAGLATLTEWPARVRE